MDEVLEYITKENITLLVAVLTLICTIYGLYQVKRSAKKSKREELARKEAQLRAMEESSRHGMDYIAASSIRVQIAALHGEIEELKQQL